MPHGFETVVIFSRRVYFEVEDPNLDRNLEKLVCKIKSLGIQFSSSIFLHKDNIQEYG